MSKGNYFEIRRGAYDLRRKEINTTYTVRLGGASDNFITDAVIDIKDPAANFTVTLGSGTYIGQEIVVVMSSDANSKTGTLSVTNHETSDPETFTHSAADEYTLLIWTGTEWATISNSSTAT